MLLQWHDGLSVGNALLDEEHRTWMGFLNALHNAIENNEGDSALERTLTEAMDYTSYHFRHEELLFTQSGYPDKDKHLDLHKKIEDDLINLRQRFQDGERDGLSLEFMVLLKKWLIHHIQQIDTGFVPYLTKTHVA